MNYAKHGHLGENLAADELIVNLILKFSADALFSNSEADVELLVFDLPA